MAMRDINRSGDPYEKPDRSIRSIPVHNRKPDDHPAPPAPRRRRRVGRLMWFILFLIVCIVGGVVVSTMFAGATVHISPRAMTVTPPATVEAKLNAPVGTLNYEIVSTTRSATTSVAANGNKQVSRQASGLITVYNSFAASPQRLIANTRFEAADGKIYRIRDSVTVPGMSGSTPGSVTATVYADSPGPAYNRSGATTFTLPGFKGDPRYAKFSAKSEGEISGGFVGQEPAISDADLATAKTNLQKQVENDVRSAASTIIPTGYVAIPGSLRVTFSAIAQGPGSNGAAAVSESATATGAIVTAAQLASAIAQKSVPEYKGEPLVFSSSSQLQAEVSTTTDLSSGTLTISLTGSATLVWEFNAGAVIQALVGKPKAKFQDIVESFAPAIRCTSSAPCDASIRPFWQSTFPTDASKIQMIIAPVK